MRRRLAITLMIVVGSVCGAATASAQVCNVINTNVSTFGSTKVVLKYFSMPQLCSRTASNAGFCSPTASSTVTAVLASANTGATMAPFCNWNCACGTVVIDSSDGLPVELLSFEVTDGEVAADEDDELDGAESPPLADAKPPKRDER